MMFLSLNKKYLINILASLIYLLPLGLVIGAAVVEVLIFFICISFFIINFLEKESISYYKSTFFKIFIIFFFYSLFVSIFSEFFLNSIQSTLFYFRFAILTLAIWFLIERLKNFQRYMLLALIASFTIVIFFGFIDMFKILYYYRLLPKGASTDYRVSGIFGSEQIMGSYLVRLYPLVIGLYFQFKTNIKKKIIFSIFLLLVFFMIVNSGERASIALMIFSFFIILIFSPIKFFYKKVLLISMPFFLFLMLYSNPYLKARVVDNTINLLNENNKLNIFSRGHQEHFTSAIKMFSENKLFGVGVRNFRMECRKDSYREIGVNSCTTHPHNTYVQFLAETGLVGFSFVILILFYITYFFFNESRKIFLNKKVNFTTICVASCILINLFPFITTGSFFNNWISAIYYFPVGFFLYYSKRNI